MKTCYQSGDNSLTGIVLKFTLLICIILGPSKVVGQVLQRLWDWSNKGPTSNVGLCKVYSVPWKLNSLCWSALVKLPLKIFKTSTPPIDRNFLCEGPRTVASGPENLTSVGHRPLLTVCDLKKYHMRTYYQSGGNGVTSIVLQIPFAYIMNFKVQQRLWDRSNKVYVTSPTKVVVQVPQDM